MATGDILMAAPDLDDRLLVGGRDAARVLSVSQRTLHTLAMRGDIPSIRIGARRLYSLEQLRGWIDSRLAAEGAQ